VRERRLRRAVQRLDGCLPSLRPRLRRVLVLRAGIGSERPHSRAGVARVLDIPVRRVGRLERRGLRTLRRAGRTTGCADAGAAPAGTGSAAGTGGDTRFVSGGGAGPGTAGEAAAGGPGHWGAEGARGPSAGGPGSSTLSPGSGEVLGTSAERPPGAAAAAAGRDVAPLLLALILGLAVTAGAMAIRRELH
jgi:hypothetical protein